MSALTIILLLGGWLVVVLAILTILTAAKQADQIAERDRRRSAKEHEAFEPASHGR